MPRSPRTIIYEINTATYLHDLSMRFGSKITLGSIPDVVWDEIASYGANTVWFMGVWKRSPIARTMALKERFLRKALPDLRPTDVLGSAYSVNDYVVDAHFGGNEGLSIARSKLKKRGLRLMLDYVPNHVAIDHSWVRTHPEYLLSGTVKELADRPDAFIQTPSGIVAKAKDPTFPPWSDVVQLNAFSLSARAAFIDTIKNIASMCDAVRCDMAMLMMNDIFAKTWGKRAGAVPKRDFWPQVIGSVKKSYPDFQFLAEVYWKREQQLIKQGFDICYDKEFYDELLTAQARSIRKRLEKGSHYQWPLLHFIENHDEERAARTMQPAHHKAAAVIAAFSPGSLLLHEGQFDGRAKRVPVQLGRRPHEDTDERIHAFYCEFVSVLKRISIDHSQFKMIEARTHFLRRKSPHVIAWQWRSAIGKTLVVVNFSPQTVKVRLAVPGRHQWQQIFGSSKLELRAHRNDIELNPWHYSILRTK